MMYEFKTRLGSHLYNRLPRLYRFADSETDYTLARFLDALGGSLDYTHNSVEEILKLLDVEKMDVRFLSFYARMFGVTYENDVPEEFQRKFLANLVDIFKRKGTKEAIEFIAREITGMEADVREAHHFTFRTWGTNPHDEMIGGFTIPKTYDSSQDFIYYLGGNIKASRHTVYITLYTEQALEDVDIREELIRRYCEGIKPHYTTLVFRVRGVSIEDEFIHPNIEEEYKDLYNFGDVKQSNIQVSNDYAIIKTKDMETMSKLNIEEEYLHNSNIEDDSEYIALGIMEIDKLHIIEELIHDTLDLSIDEYYGVIQKDILHQELKVSNVEEYQGRDLALCEMLDNTLELNIVDEYEDNIVEVTPSTLKTPNKRRKKNE